MIDNRTQATPSPVVTAQLDPKANPAEGVETKTVAERKRIPMSIPIRRLEVPEIVGYHLHWFLEGNVPRAKQGGYELVQFDEVAVNQRGVGTDSTITGNTSLGGNVEVTYGTGPDGKPATLYLMKIKKEWFNEDQQVLANRNLAVVQAIFKGEAVAGPAQSNPSDANNRYVKKDLTTLLNRGVRKQP